MDSALFGRYSCSPRERAMERRLSAILTIDVAGYSRLMGEDEAGTLERLMAHRGELIDPKIAEHHGRIVKLIGDGALVEFASVVDAVSCAVDIQREMAVRIKESPAGQRIELRIGINIGDIIVEGNDIYGDGVNVAARLEAMAEPGGICISRSVRDQVRDKIKLTFEDLGDQAIKNISRPVRVFRVLVGAAPQRGAGATLARRQPERMSIAVLPFVNMSGDPGQEYFADGISEEIITALSRFHSLNVVGRNSSFAYKGQSV